MRRLSLIVTVFAVAACSALRDAFSAHPQIAGTAAGETLSVNRLASVVGHAQRRCGRRCARRAGGDR